MHGYRKAVDRLIAGPHTLREGRELYAYAGWLSRLLAWLAFELGSPTTAEAYGVDAWHQGWQAGHDELCAWAMDVNASITPTSHAGRWLWRSGEASSRPLGTLWR